MRSVLYILGVLLAGMFVAMPQTALAQLDMDNTRRNLPGLDQASDQALYGSNPYASEEEGEPHDPSDTTRKEKKPRKPLESYFFSDSIRALPSFQWTVKRDYNRIELQPMDTTLMD